MTEDVVKKPSLKRFRQMKANSRFRCATCGFLTSGKYYHETHYKGHQVELNPMRKIKGERHAYTTGVSGETQLETIDPSDVFIARFFGRVEAQLESYAASFNIPAPVLAARVAELLRGKAYRQVLGTVHPVSSLPRIGSR